MSPVPTAPNECVILGRIVKIDYSTEGLGMDWLVDLKDSIDVSGSVNLARRKVGSVIRVLVHSGIKKIFQLDDFIKANVIYKGDERGSAFFVVAQNIWRMPKGEVE